MAWIRKSDGTRTRVTAEEVWGKPQTKAEIAARAEADLQSELDAMTDRANDRDKAFAFLMADMWRAANPGMTQNEARVAVRDRLRTHLRDIKGL